MIFADADQSYPEAEFVILGISYEDEEMSFRKGASDAPDFIRYESWNYESYCIKHNVDLQNIAIHDAGNFNIEEGKKFVKKVMEDRKTPIVIGGAHSITPYIISSLPKDFGVVILDAHMDFRDEYMGNKQSHACSARRIFEAVGKEKIISFGIRSASQEEIKEAKSWGIVDGVTTNPSLIKRAVDAARKRDIASGGKMQIATITKKGFEFVN